MRYPKGAPDAPDSRAESLGRFFDSFSPRTSRWVSTHRSVRDEKWLHYEKPRTRLAHWSIVKGHQADPHHLAVLSLLLGHWPLGMITGRVARVVDKERNAMAQVLRRLRERDADLVSAPAKRRRSSR